MGRRGGGYKWAKRRGSNIHARVTRREVINSYDDVPCVCVCVLAGSPKTFRGPANKKESNIKSCVCVCVGDEPKNPNSHLIYIYHPRDFTTGQEKKCHFPSIFFLFSLCFFIISIQVCLCVCVCVCWPAQSELGGRKFSVPKW
jgi:hypothetical protein